jgi:predicted AlkP superfamily pyrophosphatase or phosphodiesterase
MKLFTAFIDGLKPESIEHMEFLNSLGNKKRIKTKLGYSNPCHASMYTGVKPNKHLYWFISKHSPGTSCFKWMENLKINRIHDNIYTKYACYRISKFLDNSTSFYGVPFYWDLPINKWHNFDPVEKKFWTDVGYSNYPTVFEILREHNISYESPGLEKTYSSKILDNIERYDPKASVSWTYFFIGDIDAYSHRYGQSSEQTKSVLKRIDSIIYSNYKKFSKIDEDFYFMLFSDHGHIDINEKINLSKIFKDNGKKITDYIYFIDSNYARFWFNNSEQEKDVRSVLSHLGDKGFILTDDILKSYDINMPDNRYGDLIFYLDKHFIFDKGEINVFGKKMRREVVSMHGYLPDYSESDGVLISNKNLVDNKYIQLEDIPPSILRLFNISIPNYMEGDVIWKF